MSETIKTQSKSRRGGKRPGAGRKPFTIRGVIKKLPKPTAELILAEINHHQKWVDLAACGDPNVELKVLMYLTDRAYGKAPQAIELTGKDGGPIQHQNVDLSRLTEPELRQVEQLIESVTVSGTSQG